MFFKNQSEVYFLKSSDQTENISLSSDHIKKKRIFFFNLRARCSILAKMETMFDILFIFTISTENYTFYSKKYIKSVNILVIQVWIF